MQKIKAEQIACDRQHSMPFCTYTYGSSFYYVDKMRWVGGQTMPIFVHIQSKNVQIEVFEIRVSADPICHIVPGCRRRFAQL